MKLSHKWHRVRRGHWPRYYYAHVDHHLQARVCARCENKLSRRERQ
jgi:hypothetical protein